MIHYTHTDTQAHIILLPKRICLRAAVDADSIKPEHLKCCSICSSAVALIAWLTVCVCAVVHGSLPK